MVLRIKYKLFLVFTAHPHNLSPHNPDAGWMEIRNHVNDIFLFFINDKAQIQEIVITLKLPVLAGEAGKGRGTEHINRKHKRALALLEDFKKPLL